MRKTVKVILLILGAFVVVFVALYFLATHGFLRINIVPNARTLYIGYVEIEPISFSEIKARLEERGCRAIDYEGEKNPCQYAETVASHYEEEVGIEVHPRGFGFGPSSFFITENKLWDTKDIPGPPSPDKFKEAVREDLAAVGNIVRIKESSWKITEARYPW